MLEALYITDIGYYPKARFHHRKRMNGAVQHILVYCVKGKGQVSINGVQYTIEPGHFFVIPRRVSHEYSAENTDPWTIYWVHFTGSNAGNIVDFLVNNMDGYCGFVHYEPSRTDLFNNVYDHLKKGYAGKDIVYACLLLNHFLATFTQPRTNQSHYQFSGSDVVSRTIHLMQEHLGSRFSMSEMAAEVNTSLSHLSFLFKKKTGYPPVEYFNHLKIQQVCQYLLLSDIRVKEIAGILGIDDPYYFSRLFKKLMGVAPNQYRKMKK